jgi:hypothetical protein
MERCVQSSGCHVILVDGTNEYCYNKFSTDQYIVLKTGAFYVNKNNYNLDSSISTTYENQLIIDVKNKTFITLKNRKGGAYVEDTSTTTWSTAYTLAKIYINDNKILLGVNDTNGREYLVTYSGTTASVILKQTVMNNSSVTKFDHEVVTRCSSMNEFQLSSAYICRVTECPAECKYSEIGVQMTPPNLYYSLNNIDDHCYKKEKMTLDTDTGQCTKATYVPCSPSTQVHTVTAD